MNEDTFETFKTFIEGNLGIKLPPSKQVMLESRLGKRLRALKFTTYEQYCAYVFSPEGFDKEIQHLIDEVTTNETDFFRESVHYDLLLEKILPELVINSGYQNLNVWSVAASTGQEAYTLAMVLEEFSRNKKHFSYRILATDISEKVLQVAQTGIYTEHQASKISQHYKMNYCMLNKNPNQKTVRIRPEIREKVMFRKLNLMDSSYPITKKYQIVFCRNVFIYFDRPTQKKVLDEICAHLSPGGYLFMGHSENISNVDLPLINIAAAVYQKKIQG